MNSIKQNYPCKCGHEAKLHEYVAAGIGEEWCNGTESRDYYTFGHNINNTPYVCQCFKYVPDNLVYLEQLYKRKKK